MKGTEHGLTIDTHVSAHPRVTKLDYEANLAGKRDYVAQDIST